MGFPNASPSEFGAYKVVATDYDNYTLIYNCPPVIPGVLYYEFAWILARERSLSDEKLQEVKGIVKEKLPLYKWYYFRDTYQEKFCKYDF